MASGQKLWKNDDQIDVETRDGKSTLKVIKIVAKWLPERMRYRSGGAFGSPFDAKMAPRWSLWAPLGDENGVQKPKRSHQKPSEKKRYRKKSEDALKKYEKCIKNDVQNLSKN